jgi:hypothetical protein
VLRLIFAQLLGNCDKINSIKIGNYNNIFIMTRGNRIFTIKYNIEDKKAYMTKIYDPYHKKHFHDIIDSKNEEYILCDPKGLKVFKDYYRPENIIKTISIEYYFLLINLNNNLFLAEGKDNTYYFYDFEKYEKIKSIILPLDLKYEGMIGNNLLVFTRNYTLFYFFDIKYLEIVQKLEYLKSNRYVTIFSDNLYELLFEKDSLEIKKYNIKEGSFNDIVKVKTGYDDIALKNIKLIHKNYIFIALDDEFEIFNY